MMNRRNALATFGRYAALAVAAALGLRGDKAEGKGAPLYGLHFEDTVNATSFLHPLKARNAFSDADLPCTLSGYPLPDGREWDIVTGANSPGFLPHDGPCDFNPGSLRCVLCGKRMCDHDMGEPYRLVGNPITPDKSKILTRVKES